MTKIINTALLFGLLIAGNAFADRFQYTCTGTNYGNYSLTWDDRVGGSGRLIVIRDDKTLADLNIKGIVFESDIDDPDVLHLKGGSVSNYFIDFAVNIETPLPPQPDAYLAVYGGVDNSEADHLQLKCTHE